MKFSRALLGMTTICFSYNCLAMTVSEEIECPPISKIMNVTFTKADQLDFSETTKAWLLTSSEYNHDGKKWSTAFRVGLTNATNEIEALSQGEDYFKTKVTLSNPYSHTQSEYFICIYAKVDNTYIIGAVTPPIHGPITIPDLV